MGEFKEGKSSNNPISSLTLTLSVHIDEILKGERECQKVCEREREGGGREREREREFQFQFHLQQSAERGQSACAAPAVSLAAQMALAPTCRLGNGLLLVYS